MYIYEKLLNCHYCAVLTIILSDKSELLNSCPLDFLLPLNNRTFEYCYRFAKVSCLPLNFLPSADPVKVQKLLKSHYFRIAFTVC